ncbi:MAG: HEAT repeat domain-containing protein [Bacteroidetes bacterium]|nr:HEAT repeat domain-containing protein [Bacteroidota bacterium]
MEHKILESLLIDYIDGRLDSAEAAKVDQLLKEDSHALQLFNQLKEVINQMKQANDLAPTSESRQKFLVALENEVQLESRKDAKHVFFSPYTLKIAAGFIMLMAIAGIGYWLNKTNEQQKQIARLQEQMDSTKNVMMAMIVNPQSASQRMQGVAVSYQIKKADDEIVNALFDAMYNDPSTNVRLAALEALAKFSNQPNVKDGLIKSLSKQKDPMVQISLIQLLVDMKEKAVINELERISRDKEVLKAVKDEAYAGILRLS